MSWNLVVVLFVIKHYNFGSSYIKLPIFKKMIKMVNVFSFFMLEEIEFRASCMLSICYTTELHKVDFMLCVFHHTYTHAHTNICTHT